MNFNKYTKKINHSDLINSIWCFKRLSKSVKTYNVTKLRLFM